MGSDNETIAEIAEDMRSNEDCHGMWHSYADRIEAAHRRAVAELRECLKPILSVHLCDGGTQLSDALCAVAECKLKCRKVLKGAKDEGK